MNYPVDDKVCDHCHKPFTLMDWVDRHEENMGDDMFPDMKVYHQECCPSCEDFWGNVQLTNNMEEYL